MRLRTNLINIWQMFNLATDAITAKPYNQTQSNTMAQVNDFDFCFGSKCLHISNARTKPGTWINLKCSHNSIYLIIDHFHDVLAYPALLYIFLIYIGILGLWNIHTMLKYVLQCFAITIIAIFTVSEVTIFFFFSRLS